MARLRDAPDDTLHGDFDVHLVVGVDLDRDIFAQRLAARAVLGDGVNASHRIRWNPGFPPLDDVAVFVIMGRLDDIDVISRHYRPPRIVVRVDPTEEDLWREGQICDLCTRWPNGGASASGLPPRSVKRIAHACNAAFPADCGRSRRDPRRSANRPIEASKTAIRNGCLVAR